MGIKFVAGFPKICSVMLLCHPIKMDTKMQRYRSPNSNLADTNEMAGKVAAIRSSAEDKLAAKQGIARA